MEGLVLWKNVFLLIIWIMVWGGGVSSTGGDGGEVCEFAPNFELEDPLRIGAWNAQKLGRKKMSDKKVVDALIKVMLRYDIIVLQEITDYTLETPVELLERLNEAAYFAEADFDPNHALKEAAYDIYEIAMSDRIGRKRYKEQYAFYYREDRVILNATYQYKDDTDVFQIEPYVAIFGAPTTEVDLFAIIPIHTSPDDAPEEIDALVDVYDEVLTHFGIADALILGDFNGGCSYVSTKEWEGIRLRSDSNRFEWLISDHVDTTTKGTSCPYDRIVVAGSSLKEALYEETAKPFYFDDYLHIKDQSFVEDISDHYPVEVLIKQQVAKKTIVKNNLEFGVSIEVKSTSASVASFKEECFAKEREMGASNGPSQEDDAQSVEGGQAHDSEEMSDDTNSEERYNGEDEDLQEIDDKDDDQGYEGESEEDEEVSEGKYSDSERSSQTDGQQKASEEAETPPPQGLGCGNTSKIIFDEPNLLVVDFFSSDTDEAASLLDHLSAKHPCLFTHKAMSILKYKLSHGVLSDASVYGEMPEFSGVKTRIQCFGSVCTVSLSKQTSIV